MLRVLMPTLAVLGVVAALPAEAQQYSYSYPAETPPAYGYAAPVPEADYNVAYNEWYGGRPAYPAPQAGRPYPAPPPARRVIQPDNSYNGGFYVPGNGYATPQRNAYQPAYQYNPYQYGAEPADPVQPKPANPQSAKKRGPAPEFLRTVVSYNGPEAPGTLVVDTPSRYLYLVQQDGTAIRYGIGVGRPGFEWAGEHTVTSKKEWPTWTPPAEMIERQPDLPRHMAGGPRNPLGARALYLGSTLYRIHGSNEPWSIGHAVSSGCIRMTNDDVIDLYGRVPVGAKVIVI